MNDTNSPSTANVFRPFLVLATVSLVTVALWWAQRVLIPVAVAMLLAFVLTPLMSWLQRRGLGRTLAALVSVLFALAVVSAVGLVISWQLRGLVHDWPTYQAKIAQNLATVQERIKGTSLENLEDALPSVQSGGLAMLGQLALPATEVLASALLTIVLVFFMLLGREDLRNRVVRLLGPGQVVSTTRALDDSAHRLSRYLLMQTCTNVTVGVLLAIGLTVMRVPYPLLWGFLAGALRFIPYAGTWSVAVLLGLFCAATSSGWVTPVLAFGYFAVIELLMSQVLEPLLFGHTTGVSALSLIIAITFWTWLWGPIGLMLSIPLTVCLVVLGKYVPQLEFFAVLLGMEPVLDEQTRYYQRLLARDQDEATELVDDFVEKNPLEKVYDEMLVPALVAIRRDRERGGIPLEDEHFVYEVTRAILEDTLPTPESAPEAAERPQVIVLGCPARNKADELGLEMCRRLLEPEGCRLTVLPPQTLSADVVAQVQKEKPVAVCIAALPPGGLAQALYLCKRLRRQMADLKILVGRWGQEDLPERVRERLRKAGADHVGLTLLETRSQVLPLIQRAAVAARSQKSEPALATTR